MKDRGRFGLNKFVRMMIEDPERRPFVNLMLILIFIDLYYSYQIVGTTLTLEIEFGWKAYPVIKSI